MRDLADKTVGVLRGSDYGDAWDAALASFRREEDNGAESRLQKLLLDRIDVAIVGAGPAGLRLAAMRAGVAASAFSVLPVPLLVQPICLAIAKGKGSQEKVERINLAIASMQRDGYVQRIKEKYAGYF
jgi:ABC-type amino acid transport substrate-binding protein